jgi:lipid-A-disaccharide synthase-like uncharacterized protein/protein tyrosine phosphatase (PTP) superfamily phosphohydrolase (DUF442 family)
LSMEKVWLVIGIAGQGLFFARFLVQWIASERVKRSVVPLAFWYFSLGGGGILLTYAIYRQDLVFILGQAGGLVIYLRNLYLIYHDGSASRKAPSPVGDHKPLQGTHRRIKVLLLSFAVLALLGTVGVMWYNEGSRLSFAKNFGVVVPGEIYRSGYLSTAALGKIHDRYGIRTIIDLGGTEPDTEEYRQEVTTARSLGMQRFEFVLPGDGTGDPRIYVKVLQLMADPNNRPVLVHCGAGTFRTSTAVILYQNIYQNLPLWEAVQSCRQFGYDPQKNPRHLAYLAENLAVIRLALGLAPVGDTARQASDKSSD